MARPKVFSLFKNKQYSDLFPQIELLNTPFNIFLQCASYDIIIPITETEKNILNIFEETVLKLLDYKKSTVEEIAETLCLEKDLVNYIVIRLKELGLIDENRNLTEEGKNIINFYTKPTKEIGYIPGKIFVNKDTGDILPYIHTGTFTCEDVEECSSNRITIVCGTAGNNKRHIGKHIQVYNDAKLQTPTQRKLRQMIRSYNKICDSNTAYNHIPLNFDYYVDITKSEDVVLHLQGVIQNGFVDKLIISDGFVKNSDELSKYMSSYHLDVVDTIRRKAVEVRSDEENTNKLMKHSKYNEIYTLLRVREVNDATEDEKKEVFEKNKETLKDCFSAIEWCLHYYIHINPLNESLRKTFESQTMHENKSMCIEFLKKMNVRNVERNSKLVSNIDASKIQLYNRSRQPSLYTLLPMCIAEAATNPGSPFHVLINKYPDFLTFIYELNKKSQTLRHEASAGNENDNYDYIYDRTCKYIGILLPGFELSEITIEKNNSYNTSQLRLNAEVSLSDELGSVLWENLDIDIKNELIKISPNKRSYELPTQYEYSLILSRVLESYLYQTIKYLKMPKFANKFNVISEIEEMSGTPLPQTIRTVNEFNFLKAIDKKKASLGAYVMVFLKYSDNELTDKLMLNGFINTADELCSMRKHGNQVNLSVGIDALNKYRDQVLILIKMIGEYYG